MILETEKKPCLVQKKLENGRNIVSPDACFCGDEEKNLKHHQRIHILLNNLLQK